MTTESDRLNRIADANRRTDELRDALAGTGEQLVQAIDDIATLRARVAELEAALRLAANINPYGSVENADARDAALAALAGKETP